MKIIRFRIRDKFYSLLPQVLLEETKNRDFLECAGRDGHYIKRKDVCAILIGEKDVIFGMYVWERVIAGPWLAKTFGPRKSRLAIGCVKFTVSQTKKIREWATAKG